MQGVLFSPCKESSYHSNSDSSHSAAVSLISSLVSQSVEELDTTTITEQAMGRV